MSRSQCHMFLQYDSLGKLQESFIIELSRGDFEIKFQTSRPGTTRQNPEVQKLC